MIIETASNAAQYANQSLWNQTFMNTNTGGIMQVVGHKFTDIDAINLICNSYNNMIGIMALTIVLCFVTRDLLIRVSKDKVAPSPEIAYLKDVVMSVLDMIMFVMCFIILSLAVYNRFFQ